MKPEQTTIFENTTGEVVDLVLKPWQQWKCELSQQLKEIESKYNAYCEAHGDLFAVYHDLETRVPESVDVIKNTLSRFIKNKVKEANNDFGVETHLSITTEWLSSDVQNFTFGTARGFNDPDITINGRPIWKASFGELQAHALAKYDFEGLYDDLENAKAKMLQRAYKDVAKRLASEFGMIKTWGVEELEVKQQKGKYILEMSHYGGNYERRRSLQYSATVFRTFEMESGVNGLCKCFLACLKEEENVQDWGGLVESRTKVCEGEAVGAVFFKDKIKFHLEEDVFESIISFVQNYYWDSENLATIKVVNKGGK